MAHTRSTGRVQGQGNQRNWLEDAGKQRRYNHAHAVAKSAIGKHMTCPKCGNQNTCRDARVVAGNGAKSWWICGTCGHVAISEISPAKMAQYYAEDVARRCTA